MKNPDTNSMVHKDSEIPGYLNRGSTTMKILVKNNGNEKGLQKQLYTVLNLVTIDIDKISVLYTL